MFRCFSLLFNWPMLKGPNCFHAQILWIVILVNKINFFSLQLMAHDLIAALDEMYENKKFSKV